MNDDVILETCRDKLSEIYSDKSDDPIVTCHVNVKMFTRMAEVFVASKGNHE